ncbi:hypothetical protein ACSYAD_17880 [Acaryochloris marina NIES-2412]
MLQSANFIEVAMPTVSAVQGVYQDEIAPGYSADNMTGIIQLFAKP